MTYHECSGFKRIAKFPYTISFGTVKLTTHISMYWKLYL